jgi:hypothetical protein
MGKAKPSKPQLRTSSKKRLPEIHPVLYATPDGIFTTEAFDDKYNVNSPVDSEEKGISTQLS